MKTYRVSLSRVITVSSKDLFLGNTYAGGRIAFVRENFFKEHLCQQENFCPLVQKAFSTKDFCFRNATGAMLVSSKVDTSQKV